MQHKTIAVRALVVALTLSFWFAVIPVAWAHDGTARVELSAERISAGADLEVRGINIAPEMPISLALIGAGAEFSLGSVVGDAHGDFILAVAVPREAAAGAYTVRAFGTNRVIVVAPLTIVGASAEEEGGQRGEDEPLLAPMPNPQPSTPVVAAMPAAVAAPAAPQERQFTLWPAIALAALAAVGGLALMARRRAASALK
jgi:hypothetical protein